MKNTFSFGIFAHVDAGKTTLSEQLLSIAGAIRKTGSVDRGTAHTDRLDVERRRGISVQAACAPLHWHGRRMNLIDTPGHADFAAEIERSMWVLDAAVLLISGADGVQPQAEVLMKNLRAQNIPTLIFVNKMDRENAGLPSLIEEARAKLDERIVPFDDDDALMALIAEEDEEALLEYLDGVVYPRETLINRTKSLFKEGRIFPLLAGSALTGVGVTELLDAISLLIDPVETDLSLPACGVVFALDNDPNMGRGAYVRMFSGAIKNRDLVTLPIVRETAYSRHETSDQRKITQIRDLSVDGRGGDLGALEAGEIGVVFGLGDISVGQVIGSPEHLPRTMNQGVLREPLLMVKVLPPSDADRPALQKALMLLKSEDPLLDVQYALGEAHIRVMGSIHLEILAERIRERFNLNVSFGESTIIYHETIRNPVEGFCAYLAPKPCWAVIKFLIEPAQRGTGVTYRSEVHVRKIKARYQHQIEQGLANALRQGMMGWPVDDIHITLIDGEDHQFHTHPLDFIIAAPMALMDGLRRAETVLLEPVLELRISLPGDTSGKVMSEIVAMRGETKETQLTGKNDEMILVAEVPARTSMDFPTRLAALTGGRGLLNSRVCGYRECPIESGTSCPRTGVNPLDTSKYILAARSALESEIF